MPAAETLTEIYNPDPAAVRSGDGPWQGITAGQAVLWRGGEDHTTRATDDLVALGVEAPELGRPG